jgi:hypothetical protein
MAKRKISYEQSLALEKAQAAALAARRAQTKSKSNLTPEQKAEWEAQKKEALRRYRDKKNSQS